MQGRAHSKPPTVKGRPSVWAIILEGLSRVVGQEEGWDRRWDLRQEARRGVIPGEQPRQHNDIRSQGKPWDVV